MQDQTVGLRISGYARVSTEAQAVQGTSVPEQERAIAAWCEQRGHELVHVRVDNGITGTLPAEDRPGLAEALLDIEDGRADALVVMALDRVARELTHQEAALARVWSAGGRVFEIGHGEIPQDDPRDPMRTFIRQVMGAAAQLEAGLIRTRLQRGRSLKHRRGGYAGGPLAFGELVEGVGADAVRCADPRAVEVVARMRALRDAGSTFAEVAEALNAEGVPAARGGPRFGMTVKRALERSPAPLSTAA